MFDYCAHIYPYLRSALVLLIMMTVCALAMSQFVQGWCLVSAISMKQTGKLSNFPFERDHVHGPIRGELVKM